MERLKDARGGGRVGGRIEGMSKVAGTVGGGFFDRLFGRSQSVSTGEGKAEDEGEDEDESLVWGGKGPFSWGEVEGIEIEWGVSGLGMVNVGKQVAASPVERGDGLDDLEGFMLGV